MIIGNGLLATKFEKYSRAKDIVIFASGVSNSNEKREFEFQREEDLLNSVIEKNKGELLVYFSSCDVVNKNINHLKYYKHKIRLEEIIKTTCKNYLIFRLPQVVGLGGNSNNLLNYFVQNIINKKEIESYIKTKKNILDIDDAFTICDYILTNKLFKNKVINIVNTHYYYVVDIIKAIESVLNIKAKYIERNINIGWHYKSDINNEILKACNVDFDKNYINNLLNIYYTEMKKHA